MSAETVARWNAIPLNRPDPDESVQPSSLKRTRQEDDGHADDDGEDNVSLVSRTPSPPPPDAMDVDKYDEFYTNKPENEVVTVETKIKSTNVGFSMLAKMGWVEGSPLGLSGDGRVEPVPFYVKNDLTGLGKANQDVRMIETTVSHRRELDSEKQIKETEEQRRQREVGYTSLLSFHPSAHASPPAQEAVARRAAVKSEISSVLRPFYCEVCEKQFQNVAQYDEHTNSYAHHHKVRFRDMQAAQRATRNSKEEVDKRKEKERKREEKELRKIAKAAGVKMVKPPVALAPVAETGTTPEEPSKPSGFRKSGWATVGASASNAVPPEGHSKRSGWTTVGSTQPPASTTSTQGGWATASTPVSPPSIAPPPPPPSTSGPATPQRADYSTAPAFRTGGWTSLDTSGPVPILPGSLPSAPPLPPAIADGVPPSAYSTTAPPSSWQSFSPPQPSVSRTGNPAAQPFGPVGPQWQTGRAPATTAFPASPSSQPPSIPDRPVPPEPVSASARKEDSRAGWQKFRAGAPGRRR
ncbi:hypothetical protein C8Q79DRAFT_934373 [Trametes meyenii]|nr:hypothetical protein C8Q79DRAFT_934373 [Trametes meyenii]